MREPLLEPPDDGPQADVPDRHPGDPGGELDEDQQHRAVDRVPGQDVPELVADHPAQLLLVVQVDQPRGDHDERPVPADRHRVRDRVLHDEDVGHIREVEDVGPVPDKRVDVRELALGDLDRPGQVHQPQGALVDEAEQLCQQHVEPAQLAQRDKRRPVGRVLVGAGADAGQPDACSIRN